jgi:hypothetical protein
MTPFGDEGGTMFATGSGAAYLKGHDNGYRFRDMISGTRQWASRTHLADIVLVDAGIPAQS